MKKYILIYGVIAGLIVICSMILGIVMSDGEGAASSQAIGFLIMFLAFTLIFFGTRKFRDQEQGGVITFGKAFMVGAGIAAVAGVMYVIVWEIYLNISDYAFINDYADKAIAKKESAGVSGEELAKVKADMADMVVKYGNPFFRIPVTFTEIFPVGLIVSLISAFFLRFPKSNKAA